MSLPDSKAAIREVVVGSRRIKNWEERFNYIAKKWGKKDGNRMAASLFSLIEKGKGIMRIISINQTTFSLSIFIHKKGDNKLCFP